MTEQTFRVISVNVNGIRAAAKKGFFDWFAQQNADVVCLQEIKAQEDQITAEVFHPEGYHSYFFPAERKGYSGVAIYSREEPQKIVKGQGFDEFDPEGRYIEAQYPGLSVVSAYLPSGSSSEERQAAKFRYLEQWEEQLNKFKRRRREYILCGDWNIAHKNIDLKNWKGNKKNSGFTPEERAWMDKLFGTMGWVDAFREINQEEDQYTWWSNRGQAWAKNVGWRIDYHVVSPGLRDCVLSTDIYKDERFSDHAPLIMDYKRTW